MPEIRASRIVLAFRRLRRGPERLGWRAMPWLMRAGIHGSALFAAVWLLFVPLAALDLGSYTINGRTVSGPYFLAHVYPILLPFIGLLIAIAYGYWTERLWARTLPIIFWVLVDAIMFWQILRADTVEEDAIESAVWGVVYVGVAVWYYLFKPSVDNYYRALERAFGEDATATAEATGA